MCGPMDDRVTVRAEEVGQVGIGILVYGYAERMQTEPARLMQGGASVLDPVPSLVAIQVIRFAIREQE